MRKLLAILAVLVAGVAGATVPSPTSIAGPYNCDGVQVAYSFPYPVLASSDLVVKRTVGGVDSLLNLGTDYTVSTVPAATATVTLTAGYRCPSGQTLTISRVVPLTQTTPYSTQGPFSLKSLERSFDRATMQVQQLSALYAPLAAQAVGPQGPVGSCTSSSGIALSSGNIVFNGSGGSYVWKAGAGDLLLIAQSGTLRLQYPSGDAWVVRPDNGNLEANSGKTVTNLPLTAVNAGDAASKNYVDTQINGSSTAPATLTVNTGTHWANPSSQAKYWKDRAGMCHLAGFIGNDGTTATGSWATLPSGFRAQSAQDVLVAISGVVGGGIYVTGTLRIDSNGLSNAYRADGSNTILGAPGFSLDGVAYRCQ